MKTLVIRTLSEVDGDYPVLNSIRLKTKYAITPISDYKYFNIGNVGNVVVKYTGDTYVTKGSFPDGDKMANGFTIPDYTALYVSNTDGSIIIGNKSAITSIFLGKDICINLMDVSGCSKLKSIRISSTSSVGSTQDLNVLKNLNEISCQQTPIGGDIKYLGGCTSLTSLISYDSKIYGKIEELVAEFRANGRTNGTLTGLYGFGKNVSFNNKNVDTLNFPPINDKMEVSWDDTTITLNGKTITA